MRRDQILGLLALLLVGCGQGSRSDVASDPPTSTTRATASTADSADASAAAPGTPVAAAVFPADQRLDEQSLVAAVLTRNPSLNAMRATWMAVRAQSPQEAAIPEPMLSYGLAPMSLHEPMPGQQITLTQPIPWPQKLRDRSVSAQSAADAAGADFATLRLQLTADAKQAFAADWQAVAALAVNQSSRDLVAQIAHARTSAFAAGTGDRITVLQAQMMLNELDRRAILLTQACHVAEARLNLLLHRPSDASLPPPPPHLPEPIAVPDAQPLAALALTRRPDLAAAAARVRQAQGAAGVVAAQDLPDLSVSAGYNTMWSDPDMRFMLGVEVALPLNRNQRAAARDEARAGIDRARAEQLALIDRVQFEVREAQERLLASWQVLRLLRERMIPTADQAVAAAESALASGGQAYANLLEARKQLIEIRWSEQETLAEFHQRLAELERVTGGALPMPAALPKETP